MYWKIFGEGADQILVAKNFEKEDGEDTPIVTFQTWMPSGSRLTLNFYFDSIEKRDKNFFKVDKHVALAVVADAIEEMEEEE